MPAITFIEIEFRAEKKEYLWRRDLSRVTPGFSFERLRMLRNAVHRPFASLSNRASKVKSIKWSRLAYVVQFQKDQTFSLHQYDHWG
jgi:hypothetical protein